MRTNPQTLSTILGVYPLLILVFLTFYFSHTVQGKGAENPIRGVPFRLPPLVSQRCLPYTEGILYGYTGIYKDALKRDLELDDDHAVTSVVPQKCLMGPRRGIEQALNDAQPQPLKEAQGQLLLEPQQNPPITPLTAVNYPSAMYVPLWPFPNAGVKDMNKLLHNMPFNGKDYRPTFNNIDGDAENSFLPFLFSRKTGPVQNGRLDSGRDIYYLTYRDNALAHFANTKNGTGGWKTYWDSFKNTKFFHFFASFDFTYLLEHNFNGNHISRLMHGNRPFKEKNIDAIFKGAGSKRATQHGLGAQPNSDGGFKLLVINMQQSESKEYSDTAWDKAGKSVVEVRIPIADHTLANDLELTSAAFLTLDAFSAKWSVYIHCFKGNGRAPATTAVAIAASILYGIFSREGENKPHSITFLLDQPLEFTIYVLPKKVSTYGAGYVDVSYPNAPVDRGVVNEFVQVPKDAVAAATQRAKRLQTVIPRLAFLINEFMMDRAHGGNRATRPELYTQENVAISIANVMDLLPVYVARMMNCESDEEEEEEEEEEEDVPKLHLKENLEEFTTSAVTSFLSYVNNMGNHLKQNFASANLVFDNSQSPYSKGPISSDGDIATSFSGGLTIEMRKRAPNWVQFFKMIAPIKNVGNGVVAAVPTTFPNPAGGKALQITIGPLKGRCENCQDVIYKAKNRNGHITMPCDRDIEFRAPMGFQIPHAGKADLGGGLQRFSSLIKKDVEETYKYGDKNENENENANDQIYPVYTRPTSRSIYVADVVIKLQAYDKLRSRGTVCLPCADNVTATVTLHKSTATKESNLATFFQNFWKYHYQLDETAAALPGFGGTGHGSRGTLSFQQAEKDKIVSDAWKNFKKSPAYTSKHVNLTYVRIGDNGLPSHDCRYRLSTNKSIFDFTFLEENSKTMSILELPPRGTGSNHER
eukprot:Nk52_evm18s503 gene=Nk52_evmTU18s503